MSAPPLILAAGSLQRVPFLDRLAPIAEAGFTGTSLFAMDYEALLAAGHGAADIRARIADAGLFVTDVEIIANWLPGAATKPGLAGWLTALLARSTPEHVIGIAAAVGAAGVSIGDMLGIAYAIDDAAERFAAICDRAADAGLTVALEFLPTSSIPTLGHAWAIVERAGRANGGLLVDSWHMFRSGSALADLAALPAGAIKGVQIGDASAIPAADLDAEMMHARLLPGDGALDLGGFLDAVAATGARPPIAVEVFSDALAEMPADALARACMAAARAVLAGTALV